MQTRINILNKPGMLTDVDRKQPLQHMCEHCNFETCLDLSEPIKVFVYGTRMELPVQLYTRDVASFISWWTENVLPDLNGFSGFHNIKFELQAFELVND